MKILLRSPELSDAQMLADLGRDTFLETFGHLYSDEDSQSFIEKVHSLEAIQEELRDPMLKFQVLDSGSEFLGYVKVGQVSVPIESRQATDQELRQLYVRKKCIGTGLGKQLMDWAMQEFERQQATAVYVSVFSENERAIRFYENYGFRKISEYGFHVGNQVDREWIMQLQQPNN